MARLLARLTTRTAADALTAALGLNVWVSLVLVPGLFVGAFERHRAFLLLAFLPLVPLGIGVARRSAPWLLVAFPAALLLPLAIDPRSVGGNVHGLLTFTTVALGLIAYLLGGAYLSGIPASPASAPGAASVVRSRRLGAADPPAGGEEPVPRRWRRRLRLYAVFTALSVAFPVTLLYAVNFAPRTRAFVRELYPGRAASMTVLLDVGVLLLWLALYRVCFVSPLAHHRSGDRDLLRQLEWLRRSARHPTPRGVFYLAVVGVLAGLLVLSFHLGYL